MKFSQNTVCKNALLASRSKLLVEASPWDRTYGIGLSLSDRNITDPSKWKGKNLLGAILMDVRKFIRDLETVK